MKYLLLALMVGAMAEAQELTPRQIASTYTYSQKLSLKVQHRRLLQKMAIFKQEEAYRIADKHCSSMVKKSHLMRHGKRLFYTMETSNCLIKIDALDGSIMSKEVVD